MNALKKKLKEMTPTALPNCYCCGRDTSGGAAGVSKKVKVDACHFCQRWVCNDCATKSFPFPVSSNDGSTMRGRICRVCESKFYIKQKLDEIFRNIDDKEKKGEKL